MNDRSDNQPLQHPAVILRFPRKRGRPRKSLPSRDTGTPELIMKRLKNETAEALDLCLERGIITPEEHWCGIHLRWLYTLRYGAPGVRAVDPAHLGGIEIKPDDPEWRASREMEYHEALRKLMPGGFVPIMMNLCIYNERPAFLMPGSMNSAQARKKTEAIESLRQAMDVLIAHWRR